MGRDAAIGAGIEIDPEAQIAVHHCPPHCFKPLPGKVNVLWCAWEFPELIPVEREGLGRAHIVFATARFLVDVFEKDTGVPALYAPQGIRVDAFPYKARRKPSTKLGRRFRYLWVGAPNDRKGFQHLLAAWQAFHHDPTCELYLKTTFEHTSMKSARYGNITVDAMPMSDQELCALYHSAHCFVFPSMGEGFGFTLGEAMATGLPCIYTPATALEELCKPQCGYPLKFTWDRCFEMDDLRGGKIKLVAANADAGHLVQLMAFVRKHYGAALDMGRRAGARVRAKFTWEQAGQALRARLTLVHESMTGA